MQFVSHFIALLGLSTIDFTILGPHSQGRQVENSLWSRYVRVYGCTVSTVFRSARSGSKPDLDKRDPTTLDPYRIRIQTC